jgi:hypothetical protein
MRTKCRHFLPLIFCLGVLCLGSCTAVTLIKTEPSGAKVYIEDEFKGETPYTLSDTKMFFESTNLRFEKDGYKPFSTIINRNEEIDPGAAIGGLFIWPVWLWVMKYKPLHTYELTPADR